MLRPYSPIIKFFAPCSENNYRPPFLESGLLFFVIGIFLFLKVINISVLVYLPNTSFFADVAEPALIELNNQKRQELGLPKLNVNSVLSEAARLKAKDIIEKDYFAHTSPSGITPWFWFEKTGYRYTYAGENLAVGFIDSGELFSAWYDSPSHRDNIVNGNYRETGIAVLKGNFQGSETAVVVQLFGTPAYASTVRTESAPMALSTDIPENSETQEETVSAEEQPQVIAPVSAPENGQIQDSAPETEQIQSAEQNTIIGTETLEIYPVKLPSAGFNGVNPLKLPAAKLNEANIQIFRFLATGYAKIIETAIALFLGMLVVILLLTILFNLDLNHKDVIVKTAGTIFLLAALLAINNELLIRIIPHDLII